MRKKSYKHLKKISMIVKYLEMFVQLFSDKFVKYIVCTFYGLAIVLVICRVPENRVFGYPSLVQWPNYFELTKDSQISNP